MFPSDYIVERLFLFFASERNVSWCQKNRKTILLGNTDAFFEQKLHIHTHVHIEKIMVNRNICLHKWPKNRGYRVCDTLHNPKDLNRGDQLPSM